MDVVCKLRNECTLGMAQATDSKTSQSQVVRDLHHYILHGVTRHASILWSEVIRDTIDTRYDRRY
jgi:hypothetical protein